MSAAARGPRLDQRLVALGLAASRARARALVEAGVVRVDGRAAAKPGAVVGADAVIAVVGDPCPWVSRAALKLVHALEVFEIDPAAREVLDVGASTGGFTEVCLARGARRVTALDVGREQLHPSLRADPRVVDLSPKHARELTRADLPAPPDLVVADVSFIALSKALAAPLACAAAGARLAALVKPQFEVGPAAVGKGGIVRDVAAQEAAADRVAAWLEEEGWRVTGRTDSPIAGSDGNREILIAAARR